jgi:hypothetical protein
VLLLFIIISQLNSSDSHHTSTSSSSHNSNDLDSSSSRGGLLDSIRASIPGKSIQRRLRLSERLWQKSVDDRHDMYANYKDPQKSLFPATDEPSYIRSPFTLWDFFPATFNCPHVSSGACYYHQEKGEGGRERGMKGGDE